MKLLGVYLQDLQSVALGILPFIASVFAPTPLINKGTEAKLKTKEDRDKFYEAVEYLKKPENKNKTRTIVLSDETQMTISVK